MILETTIDIFNTELDDMGIELLMPVRFSADTQEICAIREHVEKNETEPSLTKCVIYLRSGESFIIHSNYSYVLSVIRNESRS